MYLLSLPTKRNWFFCQAMALQPCILSPLLFTPSCAAWTHIPISPRSTTTCSRPSSTVFHWVGTQIPLLLWLEPLLGLTMGKSRCPKAGSVAANLLRRHRSWLTACMTFTAKGSEACQENPDIGSCSRIGVLSFHLPEELNLISNRGIISLKTD